MKSNTPRLFLSYAAEQISQADRLTGQNRLGFDYAEFTEKHNQVSGSFVIFHFAGHGHSSRTVISTATSGTQKAKQSTLLSRQSEEELKKALRKYESVISVLSSCYSTEQQVEYLVEQGRVSLGGYLDNLILNYYLDILQRKHSFKDVWRKVSGNRQLLRFIVRYLKGQNQQINKLIKILTTNFGLTYTYRPDFGDRYEYLDLKHTDKDIQTKSRQLDFVNPGPTTAYKLSLSNEIYSKSNHSHRAA